MGIEVNFTTEDVRKRFDAFLKKVQEGQIKRLMKLGEMCVNHARSVPKEQGFEDQTGNLRSSIGYAVFVDGIAVHSFYDTVKGGVTGERTGRALAEKVGGETNGICLVVTAGMNYALHVESKGRDVLTGAERLAERELPRMLEELKINILKAGEDYI